MDLVSDLGVVFDATRDHRSVFDPHLSCRKLNHWHSILSGLLSIEKQSRER